MNAIYMLTFCSTASTESSTSETDEFSSPQSTSSGYEGDISSDDSPEMPTSLPDADLSSCDDSLVSVAALPLDGIGVGISGSDSSAHNMSQEAEDFMIDISFLEEPLASSKSVITTIFIYSWITCRISKT